MKYRHRQSFRRSNSNARGPIAFRCKIVVLTHGLSLLSPPPKQRKQHWGTEGGREGGVGGRSQSLHSRTRVS